MKKNQGGEKNQSLEESLVRTTTESQYSPHSLQFEQFLLNISRRSQNDRKLQFSPFSVQPFNVNVDLILVSFSANLIRQLSV